MPLKFAFNEAKALEVLAFIAREQEGLTPFYISKILFFAEKWHLNHYGRPIIADTYIAMPMGPVPSAVKNYIDQNWEWMPEPEGFNQAIAIDRTRSYPRLMRGSSTDDLNMLSHSDVECLREAILFCRDKTPDELSKITHFEKAWREAEANRAMDYEDFIDDDNPNKEAILKMAEENAAYAIL